QGAIGLPGVYTISATGAVPEFQGEGNNITAGFLPVLLTLAPDLQPTGVTAQGPDPSQPGHVLTGQLITVNYTVKNNGPGDTPSDQGTWNDRIYLSRDQFLSDADLYFDTETHNGGLAAGTSYQKTVTFKAPRGLT